MNLEHGFCGKGELTTNQLNTTDPSLAQFRYAKEAKSDETPTA